MFSNLRVPYHMSIYGKHFPKHQMNGKTVAHKNNHLNLSSFLSLHEKTKKTLQRWKQTKAGKK